MGIIPHLLAAAASLVMVVIDVAIMLVLVRLAASRWHSRLLTAIDVAGRPVTGELVRMTDHLWAWLRTARRLSTGGRLLAALGMLMVVRLILVSLCVLLSR
jgi:hypothetical protein